MGACARRRRLASEQMALLDSLGDPTPTLGLAFILFANWFERGEFGEILRWSQTVIDLAEGDPAKGAGFGVGSPLAIALTWRGVARWWLDRPGWRQDLHDAVAMVRNSNAGTIVGVLDWTYGLAIYYGVLRADDAAVCAIEEAVQTAEGAGDDFMLGVAKYTLGFALLNRNAAADRDRGLELMVQARDVFLRLRSLFLVPIADLWAARERARRGKRDAAIPVMRDSRKRASPGRTDRLWRLGHRRFGGDVTAAWRRGRPVRGRRADRLVGERVGRQRFGGARDHAAAAACAAGPGPRRRRLPTATW